MLNQELRKSEPVSTFLECYYQVTQSARWPQSDGMAGMPQLRWAIYPFWSQTCTRSSDMGTWKISLCRKSWTGWGSRSRMLWRGSWSSFSSWSTRVLTTAFLGDRWSQRLLLRWFSARHQVSRAEFVQTKRCRWEFSLLALFMVWHDWSCASVVQLMGQSTLSNQDKTSSQTARENWTVLL